MKVTATFSSLLKDPELKRPPVIIRVNEFNNKTAREFEMQMSKAHNTGQTVVPIIIDSYGGQVYSLMSMISSIRHSELPIATIIEGKAMSCGALLYSCGEEGMRFMDPDATLMIHDVSAMVWGKVEELKASATEADRLNQKLYRMMARNCGKKEDYFLNMIHEKKHADWFLDAAEAKVHNLANQIRVPKINITVNVSIDFE
jgi:ATP-dependent Clp protease protease subunit